MEERLGGNMNVDVLSCLEWVFIVVVVVMVVVVVVVVVVMVVVVVDFSLNARIKGTVG